jgi:hypothetical protein
MVDKDEMIQGKISPSTGTYVPISPGSRHSIDPS